MIASRCRDTLCSPAKSQAPRVRAASGQRRTPPSHTGGGAGRLGRRETVGPNWGPGSQTVALCPLELPGGSLSLPLPPAGPGGVLGREALGPAANRAGLPLVQLRLVLRGTAHASSPSSTVETPSAAPASTTPARPARRLGRAVSRWQLWPEQVRGFEQGRARAHGSSCAQVVCGCGRNVRVWRVQTCPLGRQALVSRPANPGVWGRSPIAAAAAAQV